MTMTFMEALSQLMLATVKRMHEIAEAYNLDFEEVADVAVSAIEMVNAVEDRMDWESGTIRWRKKDE